MYELFCESKSDALAFPMQSQAFSKLLIRGGKKQNCFALQSSDEDDDAILEAEHMAWRRLFRPLLLHTKLENIKKGV